MRGLRLFALVIAALVLELAALAVVVGIWAFAGRTALIVAGACAAAATVGVVLWARREWDAIEQRFPE